ncbi:MAG: TM0106 family RecB-like putative nuclease, partial [Actinobacteria bacterium]|nr:TM0106 family RecB-like putative nuclease [Actinomycetota bacterium]
MNVVDGSLVLSPSDLVDFLACGHLTRLERRVAAGELVRPEPDDPQGEVLRRRGDEHERAELARLVAEGRSVVHVECAGPASDQLRAAAGATARAMAAGAEVVYQAVFFDGRWRGHADFLVRFATPSRLGPWSYEVVDTKLARRPTPAALLQLCAYSEQVARIQGTWPEAMVVVTGDGERHRHRVTDALAYYRFAKERLERAVEATAPAPYPERVTRCERCAWAQRCDARRRGDDHLSLVAGMRSDVAAKLARAGVGTVADLAALAPGSPVPGVRQGIVDRLGEQARLQKAQEVDGRVRHRLRLPAEDDRGLALLPPPSPGDLFFDIEGDPWVGDGGLEYLFGVVGRASDGGPPAYTGFWAHSPPEEKAAFEAFVDLVVAGLAEDPELHVYHYAPYEVTALKKLMGRYATRETEVDRLLRGRVFVDLYRVVRQGVLVSQEGYGLKKLEPLYLAPREGDITDGGSSIVAYEQWLASPRPSILESIRAYNEDDCRSTLALRDWLEERRAELEALGGRQVPRPLPVTGAPSASIAEADERTAALAARLTAGLPDDRTGDDAEQRGRRLLSDLLDWHRREARAEWWAWFDRLVRSDDELTDDHESLAPLAYEGVVGEVDRSCLHRYRFEPQEHKFRVGDHPVDPRTGKPAGEVRALDPSAGTVDLKRGAGSTAPHPRALVPAPPLGTTLLRQAVARVAETAARAGADAGSTRPPGGHGVALDLLVGRAPAIAGHPRGRPLQQPGEAPVDAARRLVPSLAGGYLPVQGPPGSGKTFTAAAVIVDAVRHGRRVGVSAPSHHAVANLLDAVCERSAPKGPAVRVLQRTSGGSRASSPLVQTAGDNGRVLAALDAGEVDVVGGTPWLFARDDLAGAFDLLVVDEAGQFPLANAVAVAGAAGNLVLLGDPQQLPQPSPGIHPPGAGASALGHVLGDGDTLPPERGLFLSRSFRMHPAVCRFVSEIAYGGRLEADPACERQLVDDGPVVAGAGLRWLPVAATGNRTRSPEEAAAVAGVVTALLGRPSTDCHGHRRPLTIADVLVIAPYNAQVAELQSVLPPGARVGTVDRFQGQEAPVVVYSMASSSADDVPR